MSDHPATREEFDSAVSAAPPGLSKEQFYAFVDQEIQRRKSAKSVAPATTGMALAGLGPRPRGTAPDDSGPSPLMESLSHLARPKSVGDVLGLVIPSAGAELVRPALRMMGTAYRYARAEPKVEGILGGVRGVMRGAWKGAVEEASAPNAIEKFRGPRDVPVASEPVQVQPKTQDAWDRAKAAGPTPSPDTIAEAMGKAEAQRLKDLRAANTAQFKHEEGVAAKKAADAKAANTLQFKATEAKVAQHQRDLLESGKMADKAVAEAGKTLSESERATLIAEQMAGREMRAPKITETVKAGNRTMTTSTGKGAVRIVAKEAPPTPTGAAEVVTEAPKTAPYAHTTQAGEHKFTVDRSEVSAAEAKARGYEPGEVPTDASPEASRAKAQEALARVEARRAAKTAKATPDPAQDPAYLAHLKQDAVGRITPKPTPPTTIADRPISPRDPTTGNTTSLSVEEAANEAARKRATEKYLRGIRGDTGPVTSTTETPLRAGGEIGSEGAQRFMDREFPPNNKIAQVVLGHGRVGGPKLSPMEEAMVARQLDINPGVKLTLNEEGQAARAAEIERLRTQEGGARAAKKLGMTTQEVREISGGPAGLAPVRMQQDFERKLASFKTKAERVAYLKTGAKNENATAFNLRTHYLEKELGTP